MMKNYIVISAADNGNFDIQSFDETGLKDLLKDINEEDIADEVVFLHLDEIQKCKITNLWEEWNFDDVYNKFYIAEIKTVQPKPKKVTTV